MHDLEASVNSVKQTILIENLLVITAHAEFLQAAIAEIEALNKQAIEVNIVNDEIALCTVSNTHEIMQLANKIRPIFVRHIAPVQKVLTLKNNEGDPGRIAVAAIELPGIALLERGTHFAVQSRFVQNEGKRAERPYSSGQLNQMLAEALVEETAAVEDIKKPQVVLSILCTAETAYIGISESDENLSAWPGGARHYAQTDEQISRAEFKLLEALETFHLTLPEDGRALDLGAAPGGWTRLFLEAEMRVIAVDPARLDARLTGNKKVEHYRGYAEDFFEEAAEPQNTQRLGRFDVIASDMRMDARDTARILQHAAPYLRSDGFVISTLKLPHATETVDPLINFKEAMRILAKTYGIVQAHQLFHNRQEVTVVAAQPVQRK
jgi:23S rRNA (cytidine2498-2'-O)-methyltransferase